MREFCYAALHKIPTTQTLGGMKLYFKHPKYMAIGILILIVIIIMIINSGPKEIDPELVKEARANSPECSFMNTTASNDTEFVVNTNRIYDLNELNEQSDKIMACHKAVVRYLNNKRLLN